MREQWKYAAALIVLAALSGCGVSPLGFDTDKAALITAPSAYYLTPGDRLKINVFNEPDLTGEFAIAENGNIGFPLVGEIRAAGLAVDEFKSNLIDRLQNGYVRNPQITVDVLNYRPINIIGEVKSAGQYPYRPGMSARDVAAIAGGYTHRAKEGVIHVTRGENKKQITVDLDDGTFPILPGDNVRIPERYF